MEQKVKKEEPLVKIKLSPKIDLSQIKGELYPYQKLGVEFFVSNNGRALLADEPGTGKTLQ